MLDICEKISDNTKVNLITNDCHDNSRFPGRYLLQHWQNLIHDQPLVQVLEQLADADQSVDSDREEVGVDAQLLDAGQQGIFHSLVIE